MDVPIRVLKDKLSEYLRRVQGGERVVVTDHDRPVAVISPVRPDDLAPEERLELLAASGEVSTPRGRGFARVKPAKLRGRPIAQTIVEDRR